MDNRSSSTRQDPVTQASEFFIEFRAGDGTPTLRARFERWLRSSPENVQAYLEIAAGWSELPIADPEGRIDVQGLLDAARNTKAENVIPWGLGRAGVARPSRPRRTPFWSLAVSLALLAMALAGTGTWLMTGGGVTYKTGIGEQRTLILADGSTVMLNALTTVRVHMTREIREVVLVRGQAYFHDTDDPGRPFVVRTGGSTVRAIGTAFDVDQESDRTVVTVLAGQVAVAKSFAWIESVDRHELLGKLAGPADKLKTVLVSAGEQVTVSAQNIPAPNSVDVAAIAAWREQRLVFDDTPLEKVAQQFNLYSKRRLVIADPALRSVGVTGEYSASDPAALIGFLRSQPKLSVVETDEQFLVTRR